MNASLILKALGIKVPEEALKQIEKLIPQIPARVSEAINVINSTIVQADERMTALEVRLATVEEKLTQIQNHLVNTTVVKEQNGKRGARSNSSSGADTPGSPN